MSTYEDDHNIAQNQNQSRSSEHSGQNRARTHQTLSSVIDSFVTNQSSGHSSGATQTSMEAFTNALRVLSAEDGSALASDLMDSLQDAAEPGPHKGISDEYLDSLDRVDISQLEKDAECPICTNRFVDDKYPLIVKLPCTGISNSMKKSRGHVFDMDCIGPWLKMNSTCPLCRFDLLELNKKRKQKLEEELRQLEDDEEEWDDYA